MCRGQRGTPCSVSLQPQGILKLQLLICVRPAHSWSHVYVIMVMASVPSRILSLDPCAFPTAFLWLQMCSLEELLVVQDPQKLYGSNYIWIFTELAYEKTLQVRYRLLRLASGFFCFTSCKLLAVLGRSSLPLQLCAVCTTRKPHPGLLQRTPVRTLPGMIFQVDCLRL